MNSPGFAKRIGFRANRLFLLALFIIAACASPPLTPLDFSYPKNPMQLPQDLAAHEWAQTEWWYYTGHLRSDDGSKYGFELTFFRRRVDMDRLKGVPLRALGNTGYMAHFAVVDEAKGQYLHAGISDISNNKGRAHASTDRYDVAILKWKAGGDDKVHHIQAKSEDAAINLQLEPIKPAVLHGDHGIVPKGRGMANYYMSYTRMKSAGTLTIDGKPINVTGISWFDHEYGYMGSEPVDGWDWYSIQLDDNTEYMIYGIRRPDKSVDPASKACRIDTAGAEECIPIAETKIEVLGRWRSPDTDALYPAGWHIVIPKWNLDVVIVPTFSDQEFRFIGIAYWEGSCAVLGKPANGRAYVELVGYEVGKIMGMMKNQ